MCRPQSGGGATSSLLHMEAPHTEDGSASRCMETEAGRSSELSLSIRNTFIDVSGTISGLLTAREREALLQARGGADGARGAATCCAAALGRTPDFCVTSGEEEDSEAEARPDGAAFEPSPAVRSGGLLSPSSQLGRTRCASAPSAGLPLSSIELWRARSDSEMSSGLPLSSIELRRARSDSEMSAGSTVSTSTVDSEAPLADDAPQGLRRQPSTYLSAQPEGSSATSNAVQPGPGAPPRAVRGQWSVGAEGHELQRCKPCAFLDSRKGCMSGSACLYCHICDPGEKKRRLKEEKRRLQQPPRA